MMNSNGKEGGNRLTDTLQVASPGWRSLTIPSSSWIWNGNVLQEASANNIVSGVESRSNSLGKFVVDHIYGRQNKTRASKAAIRGAVKKLGPDQYGLNFGAGGTRYAPNLLNLDLMHGPHVDIISAGTLRLPFKDGSLHLIVCQEVLEHVDRPQDAIGEFHRVLHPGGEIVLQLPFIIGYHPGPKDFWRFSTEAYDVLLPAEKWRIFDKQITVGHGSGLHRILTEFIAVHFSLFGGKIYRLAKGLVALLLSPLIFFDLFTRFLPERDRVAGGYVVRARVVK
jgi:SAM-dependent methyltransferase